MELNSLKSEQEAFFYRILFFVVLFMSAVIFTGCVSTGGKPDVLAYVDADVITTEDLADAVNVAHRRDDLSSAGELDMYVYLNKLINERLIVQEARRMVLQEHPVVMQKVEAYVVRESVLLLHEEEIINKVSYTEEDIRRYYTDNYKTVTLDAITIGTEQDAVKVKEMISGGADITGLSKDENGISRLDLGAEITYQLLTPDMKKGVDGLMPGEVSDVIQSKGIFYLLRLIGYEDAADEKFEGRRNNIEENLKAAEEDERSAQYIKELRDTSSIKIDHDILSSLKLGVTDDQRHLWADDERLLVEINGEVLTVGGFIKLIPAVVRISNEDMLNNWITRKLVDQEALRRRYDLKPKLKGMLMRYENRLLQDLFRREVVMPNITVSEELLTEYYDVHKEEYLTPARYRLSMIVTETRDEADEIHSSLQKGADFPWFARMRSMDLSSSEKGGLIGWFDEPTLPVQLQGIIGELKPGDITSVVEIDSLFNIFLLNEKVGVEIKPFEAVKQSIYKAYMDEQYREKYREYIQQLKVGTDIVVDEGAVRSFEKNFK